MLIIDPYLFVKLILIGLLIGGLFALGGIGLKALFKWLKNIGM